MTHPDGSPVPTRAAATRTLPRNAAIFTGRDRELAQLADLAADATSSGRAVGICAIGGMTGIGSTALALRAAHGLAGKFPDGQVFLPLHRQARGYDPVDPADALASLLLTAGVAAQHIPPGLAARIRLWRDYLASKRMLVLLDDAAGPDQLRALLPGTAGSLVMVTSRSDLTALEDVRTVSLGPLPPDASAELLVKLSGRDDLAASDARVNEITRLCGYLPLAIGMLARQLHHHPGPGAARLAADLAGARDRLARTRAGDLPVAAAFDLSYHALTAAQQRLFRHLGLHPGTGIDVYSAAALDGTSPAQARYLLEAICDRHLLTEIARGRYQFHDVIRERARRCGEALPAGERARAMRRLLDYYLRTTVAAGRRLDCLPASASSLAGDPPEWSLDLATREDAVVWVTAERLGLHGAVRYAAAHNLPRPCLALAAALHGPLRALGYWDQAAALHGIALAVAQADGDRRAEADALAHLGEAQYLIAAHQQATANLSRALELYRDAGDRLGEAGVHSSLGAIQQGAEDFPAAIASHERSLRLYRDLDHPLGEATALNHLGRLRSATGDYHAGADCLERALALYRAMDRPSDQAQVLSSLGELSLAIAAPAQAQDLYEQALAIGAAIGSPDLQARALEGIGRCRFKQGDVEAGVAVLRRALAIYHRIASPKAGRVQKTIEALGF